MHVKENKNTAYIEHRVHAVHINPIINCILFYWLNCKLHQFSKY